MADFLPENDADLVGWTTNFVTYASANLVALGLSATDMAPVAAQQAAYNTTFNANIAAQNAAQSAAQAKNAARASLEEVLRILVRKIQANAAITNAQRESLGISLRGMGRSPVGTPTTPTSKAKPEGVLGCEIWVKIGGAAPTDPSELHFLGLDTRTPYTIEYGGEDTGKTAHYMARWSSTRAEQGPWSETASATIGG